MNMCSWINTGSLLPGTVLQILVNGAFSHSKDQMYSILCNKKHQKLQLKDTKMQIFLENKLTTRSETVPSDLCARLRFRSVCTLTQSDHFFFIGRMLDSQGVFMRTKKTDQAAWKHRLI